MSGADVERAIQLYEVRLLQHLIITHMFKSIKEKLLQKKQTMPVLMKERNPNSNMFDKDEVPTLLPRLTSFRLSFELMIYVHNSSYDMHFHS